MATPRAPCHGELAVRAGCLLTVRNWLIQPPIAALMTYSSRTCSVQPIVCGPPSRVMIRSRIRREAAQASTAARTPCSARPATHHRPRPPPRPAAPRSSQRRPLRPTAGRPAVTTRGPGVHLHPHPPKLNMLTDPLPRGPVCYRGPRASGSASTTCRARYKMVDGSVAAIAGSRVSSSPSGSACSR